MAENNSSTTKNPHFSRVNRGPYELGHLLSKMPDDFTAYTLATSETRLMAEAVAQHASNGNDSLMRGLEALGEVLCVVGLNDENEVDKRCLTGIGNLIQHIATEAQFLQEVEENYRYILCEQEKLAGKKNK